MLVLCLHTVIIAEPEGEATNLDAQVAKHFYICMFICIPPIKKNTITTTTTRVQSTGGGASPPNTQASPLKVFPNAI